MKVELTDTDMEKLAELVHDRNIKHMTHLLRSESIYDEMYEKAKGYVSRYLATDADWGERNGAHDIMDERIKGAVGEEIKRYVSAEVDKALKSNGKELTKMILQEAIDNMEAHYQDMIDTLD